MYTSKTDSGCPYTLHRCTAHISLLEYWRSISSSETQVDTQILTQVNQVLFRILWQHSKSTTNNWSKVDSLTMARQPIGPGHTGGVSHTFSYDLLIQNQSFRIYVLVYARLYEDILGHTESGHTGEMSQTFSYKLLLQSCIVDICYFCQRLTELPQITIFINFFVSCFIFVSSFRGTWPLTNSMINIYTSSWDVCPEVDVVIVDARLFVLEAN